MKNDYYLRKEILRNMSIERDALKDHLNSLKRKQNRCYGEVKLVLDCEQHPGTVAIF